MGFFRNLTGKTGAQAAAVGAEAQAEAAKEIAKLQAQASKEASEITALAAEEAAGVLTEAGRQALEESRRQFDITQSKLAEAEGRLQPFREVELRGIQRQEDVLGGQARLATGAQRELGQLLGLGSPEAQMEAQTRILESPAQQALRARAQRLSTRTASAIGGLGGGNIRRELTEQGRLLDEAAIRERIGQLTGVAQFGTQGIGLGGAGLEASLAGEAGQLGVQRTGAVSGLISELGRTQAGGITAPATQRAGGLLGVSQAQAGGLGDVARAQASGILGGQQARAQGFQNTATLAAAIGSMFSDEEMKEDIKPLDLKACYEAVINLPLKAWRYLESVGIDRDLHFGPMWQESPEMIRVPGVKMLNIHDELMMVAGAIQYIKQEGILNG
jgi:hypothetical protein